MSTILQSQHRCGNEYQCVNKYITQVSVTIVKQEYVILKVIHGLGLIVIHYTGISHYSTERMCHSDGNSGALSDQCDTLHRHQLP